MEDSSESKNQLNLFIRGLDYRREQQSAGNLITNQKSF